MRTAELPSPLALAADLELVGVPPHELRPAVRGYAAAVERLAVARAVETIVEREVAALIKEPTRILR